MDPNATLEEIRRLSRKIRDNVTESITDDALPGSTDDFVRDADRLAELCLSLDEWVLKGGFLPRPWLVSKVRT